MSNKFSLAAILTVGLASVFSPLSAYGQSAEVTGLRGSDVESVSVEQDAQTSQSGLEGGLRGGIIDAQVANVPNSQDIAQRSVGRDENLPVRGFLPGVGASVSYLAENTLPELLFRGTSNAVEVRDVVYMLPNFGALRNSMMHSANAYQGLRTQSASVGDTVASALRGSYIGRAQLERANVDRARSHAAFANFLPKLTGTIEGSRRFIAETSRRQETDGQAVTGSLELTVPIFTSGVNTNTYKRAQHLSRASDYNYLAEEHRIALEAISAHINLRLNRQVEYTLQSNVFAMRRISIIARSLFIAGDASRTDIAIADANVESAKAELANAHRSTGQARVDYESLTGNHAPSALDIGRIDQFVPDTLEQAIETALQFNPTLNAAEHTATASKHAAHAERARFGPQVNAFANYNHDLYTSIDEKRTNDWAVGVRLTVPIFDLTAAPTIAAARHESLESGYRALDQGRLVKRQIERQWVAYTSAKRRTRIVQKQVKALKASVFGAKKEFAAGYRSITDVLTDQVGLARAQITLETARHERMLAAYQLVFTTADPALRTLPELGPVAGLN